MNDCKKMLILYILDLLKKNTDEEHTLTQKEIEKMLEEKYDMTAERKAIKRNLEDLIDYDRRIKYTEISRKVTDPLTGEAEERTIHTDFYYDHEFTDGELILLLDGFAFSKSIPERFRRDLIEKLENLSSVYFREKIRYLSGIRGAENVNKQIFLNIEEIEKAISKKKKITFRYLEYGTDKKMHPRKRSDGTELYTVSPYQMAAKEGKYYLICNFDKYDDISNYRIDRMKDTTILDERAKPFETLKGSDGRELDLSDYMNKHVYMYASENCRVKFRITRPMISDVIDMFGTDVTFSEEDETGVTVSVLANEMSVEHFAQSFAPDVVILEPKALAEKVRNRLRKALERYQD